MFYYLSQLPEWLASNGHAAWADWLSPLRVFQYITFRGAGAAVTNAIYNACGVRVRDFPLTLDKIVSGLPEM